MKVKKPLGKKRVDNWTVILDNKKVSYLSLENYIVWLQCGMRIDGYNYEVRRTKYHAAIFDSVGLSRVRAPESFNMALNNLLCDLFACSKCKLTTNNDGFCQTCNRTVTIDNMVNRLKKKAVEIHYREKRG